MPRMSTSSVGQPSQAASFSSMRSTSRLLVPVAGSVSTAMAWRVAAGLSATKRMLSGPKVIGPTEVSFGVPVRSPYPTACSELRIAIVALPTGPGFLCIVAFIISAAADGQLPEVEPMQYQVISTDNHINEPPGTYVDRVPTALRDKAPRILRGEDGGDGWS